jgi:hypothetical protein
VLFVEHPPEIIVTRGIFPSVKPALPAVAIDICQGNDVLGYAILEIIETSPAGADSGDIQLSIRRPRTTRAEAPKSQAGSGGKSALTNKSPSGK